MKTIEKYFDTLRKAEIYHGSRRRESICGGSVWGSDSSKTHMTRKDYNLIAEAIRKAYWEVTGDDQLVGVTTVVEQLCEKLKEANSNFQSSKFRRACGVPAP